MTLNFVYKIFTIHKQTSEIIKKIKKCKIVVLAKPKHRIRKQGNQDTYTKRQPGDIPQNSSTDNAAFNKGDKHVLPHHKPQE